MIPLWLNSKCASLGICRNPSCPEIVKRCPLSGRWYITMGHAGFNTPANNMNGYLSAEKAKAVSVKLSSKAVR